MLPRSVKIITWNVNSIRQRLARAVALIERHQPDILCLQETKTTDEGFPAAEFEDLGLHVAHHGQDNGRNGVAILSRRAPVSVERGFEGDPLPEQARAITTVASGLRVVNLYVVNGKTVSAPEYAMKLRWLDAMVAWVRAFDDGTPTVIVGDFNVAPADDDVHDPSLWRGENLASEPERERVRALLDIGMVDLLRLHHDGPGPFTWWDYRAGAFHRGWGLRIDLAIASDSLAARCTVVEVDRNERKPTAGEGKPSDHAPVIVTLS